MYNVYYTILCPIRYRIFYRHETCINAKINDVHVTTQFSLYSYHVSLTLHPPPLTFCTLGPLTLTNMYQNMNSDLDDINTLNSQNDVSSCQYYTFQECLTSFPIIIKNNSVNGTSDVSNNSNSTRHTNDDSIKYKN